MLKTPITDAFVRGLPTEKPSFRDRLKAASESSTRPTHILGQCVKLATVNGEHVKPKLTFGKRGT